MPNSSDRTTCMTLGIRNFETHQRRARAEFEEATDTDLDPWAWIVTTCDEPWCINPQHLIARTISKILYPPGVCVYCGMPAGTKDHLTPRHWSGEDRRRVVAVVPACGECNSRIGASLTCSVTERRAIAHKSIRKSKRMILSARRWTQEDLDELGPGLRGHVEKRQQEREVILARLSWPEDPDYDVRAFQQSGIDDPWAVGLLGKTEATAA